MTLKVNDLSRSFMQRVRSIEKTVIPINVFLSYWISSTPKLSNSIKLAELKNISHKCIEVHTFVLNVNKGACVCPCRDLHFFPKYVSLRSSCDSDTLHIPIN